MRTRVPLPPYLPDQSANSGVLLEAKNSYPRVDGYGPVNAFASFSNALGADFRGGGSFISTAGISYLLVGTSTGLVRYAAGAWTDLVTLMTVTGRWRFTQFGDFVVAVNGVVTKVVNLNSGVASNLAGAPAGVCIATVGDYVVIGQAAGDLLRVTNSAANNHTGWTPGVAGSTFQPMLTGGEVMGLAGGEYGVILQRQRLVRMTRTGDSLAPFQYDEITPNVGCASKASVVQVGRTVFFLSDRGFMALEDGQAIRPIGSEKVDRTFQSLVARDEYERLFSAFDPVNKLVIWCVPGSPGTLWEYNIELDRWATMELPISGVFSGFTSSLTLEEVSALYPNIDTMPYTLDDPRFSGGNPRLYAVNALQVGTFTGATLKASFQLGFGEYTKGRRARFRAVSPVTDAISGLTVALDCRARMGDVARVATTTSLRDSGTMPIRAAGRYTKARLEIAAGTLWTYAQGIELDVEAGGER